CDGAGRCVPGAPPACGGACFVCDPAIGCMQKAAGAKCDDGDACTAGKTGDHCSGTGNACVPGAPVVCDGECLTGACDAAKGCVPKPTTTPCDDGDACTVGDHCSKTGTCVPAGPRTCSGACLTGTCDPGSGCRPAPAGTVCRGVAGPCDVAETCDGETGTCPADSFLDASTVCRAAAGPCDVPETCTGGGPACPADHLQPAGATCRAADDPCRLEDVCTGTTAACPVGARTQKNFEAISCAFERTTD